MKRRVNIELFIDERAALYIQKGAHRNKDYSEECKIVSAKEHNRWELETITAVCLEMT